MMSKGMTITPKHIVSVATYIEGNYNFSCCHVLDAGYLHSNY